MKERKKKMNKRKIVKCIKENIEIKFKSLRNMEKGSEEYTETLQSICSDYEKFEEFKNHHEKSNDEFISEWIKLGIELVGAMTCVVSSVILPYLFMERGFRFEETGSYTSKTFQNSFGKFRFK